MKKVIIALIALLLAGGIFAYIYHEMTTEKTYYSFINFTDIPETIKNNEESIIFMVQDGCPHCKEAEPIVNQYAKNHKNIVHSVVINKQKNLDEGMKKYNIKGTPTLIYYKDGKEIYRTDGGFTSDAFDKVIKKVGFE